MHQSWVPSIWSMCPESEVPMNPAFLIHASFAKVAFS